jgi:hypothetical protein
LESGFDDDSFLFELLKSLLFFNASTALSALILSGKGSDKTEFTTSLAGFAALPLPSENACCCDSVY